MRRQHVAGQSRWGPGGRRGFARLGMVAALGLAGGFLLLVMASPSASRHARYGGWGTRDPLERGMIGALISGRPTPSGYFRIRGLCEGMPASEAGIRPGDLITEVDGQSVAGMSSGEVVLRIRGQVGTPVEIRVVRDEMPGDLMFWLVREPLERASGFEPEDEIDPSDGFPARSHRHGDSGYPAARWHDDGTGRGRFYLRTYPSRERR